MRAFRIILTGLISLLIVWFAIFGGEIFLPMIDRETENYHWSDYLLACRPDEMRMQNYIAGRECQKGILNLTTGELVGAPAPVVTSYANPWQRMYQIFHTFNFPERRPYTKNELTDIKSALERLPPPPSTDLESYHDRFHISFYRDNHLVLYDCPRITANEDLSDLFRGLKFRLEHGSGFEINLFAQ